MAIGDEAKHHEKCVNPDVHPEPFNMELEVLQSAAGYYLGTHCDFCGPYGRESGYFPTYEAAEKALAEWREGNKVNARPEGLQPGEISVFSGLDKSAESFKGTLWQEGYGRG